MKETLTERQANGRSVHGKRLTSFMLTIWYIELLSSKREMTLLPLPAHVPLGYVILCWPSFLIFFGQKVGFH